VNSQPLIINSETFGIYPRLRILGIYIQSSTFIAF